MKRKEKLERRYERSAEKKQAKESGDAPDDRQNLEGDDDEGLRWTGEEEVVEEDEEDEDSQGADAGQRRENR